MAQYMRDRRSKRRETLVELKGGKCQVCGSTDTLEFNHRERTLKLFGISGAALDKAWFKILAEVEKCDLLCSEHHKDYTREQWMAGEILPWNDKSDRPYEHGTARTYSEQQCRCPECRMAKRLYRNKSLSYTEAIPR
jgi:hypothetical protein